MCICLQKHSKVVIIIISVVSAIYALALISWAIYSEKMAQKSDHHTFPTWCTIGAITLASVFIGFYSATHLDKKRFLRLYSLILMILSLVQFGVATFRFTIPSSQTEYEKTKLMHLFQQEEPEAEKRFNSIETKLECCGVKNFDDYEEKFDPSLVGYPKSCCKNKKSPCQKPFKHGCHEVIMHNLMVDEITRGVILVFFGCFMFGGAIAVWIISDKVPSEPT